jgi:hypothetical protein
MVVVMVSIFVWVLVQHFVCKIIIFFDKCGQESLAKGNDTEYAVQSSSLDRNFCDADFLPRSIWPGLAWPDEIKISPSIHSSTWPATRQSLLKNLMQNRQGDGAR